jgi:hypothetical protein
LPPYYYTQLQQEIFALDSEYGYLAAFMEKPWELFVFKVPRDDFTINKIIVNGFKAWQEVEKIKAAGGNTTNLTSTAVVDPEIAEQFDEHY